MNQVNASVDISIGGVSAQIQYAGLTPGVVGLYQFNVVVPNIPANDKTPLTFTLDGVPGTQTCTCSSAIDQNENFIASCRILGSSALVIWPKVGVPKVVLTPEAPASQAGKRDAGAEAVGQVESLGPKLKPVSFANWKLPGERHIESEEMRARNVVAAQTAERAWRGGGEGLRINPADCGPGVGAQRIGQYLNRPLVPGVAVQSYVGGEEAETQ